MRISARPPGCKNFLGCCEVRFQQPALLVIGHGKDSHGAPVHRASWRGQGLVGHYAGVAGQTWNTPLSRFGVGASTVCTGL